jgi:hypothetical protein
MNKTVRDSILSTDSSLFPNISVGSPANPRSVASLIKAAQSAESTVVGAIQVSFSRFIMNGEGVRSPIVRLACPLRSCKTSVVGQEENPRSKRIEWKCKKLHYSAMPVPTFWFQAEFIDTLEEDNDQKTVALWVSESAAHLLLGVTAASYVDPSHSAQVQSIDDGIDTDVTVFRAVASEDAKRGVVISTSDEF